MNSFEPGLSQNRTLVDKLKEFQKNPKSLVFVSLAEEYRKLGLFPQALDILLEGSYYHPEFVSALFVEAKTLADLRRFADALKKIEQILKQAPDHARALQLKADIFLRLGQARLAFEALQRLQQLFPEDLDTKRRLSEVHNLLKPRSFERFPDVKNPTVPTQAAGAIEGFEVGRLADFSWSEEKSEATPVVSLQAESTDSYEPFATRTIAELYLRQGLKAKAEAVLRRLLQENPLDSWVREALRQVSTNSTFPNDAKELVLERKTILEKKAQFLERTLQRLQLGN